MNRSSLATLPRRLAFAPALTAAAALAACTSQAGGGQSSQIKPQSSADAGLQSGDASAASPAAAGTGGLSGALSGINATVEMAGNFTITTESGAQLCVGDVTIDTAIGGPAGFGLSFPAATVDCAGVKLDISKILGAFASQALASASTSGLGATAVSSKGGIVYATDLLGATFSPAPGRPLMVGPIIQNMQQYANLDVGGTYTAAIPDPSTGDVKTASGEIQLKVLEVGATLDQKIAGLDGPLDSVLHFAITSTGFDGVNKVSGFLFDNFEMYLNARPLAVPKIIITAPLDDLTASGALSGNVAGMVGIASALLGSLTIEFDMTEFKGH